MAVTDLIVLEQDDRLIAVTILIAVGGDVQICCTVGHADGTFEDLLVLRDSLPGTMDELWSTVIRRKPLGTG